MHRTVTLTVKSKDLGKVLSSLEMSKDFEENTTLTLSIDIEDTKKNYQVLCGSPEVLEWDFIEEDKSEDEMKESVNPVTDIEEAIKTVKESLNKEKSLWPDNIYSVAVNTGKTLGYLEEYIKTYDDIIEFILISWRLSKKFPKYSVDFVQEYILPAIIQNQTDISEVSSLDRKIPLLITSYYSGVKTTKEVLKDVIRKVQESWEIMKETEDVVSLVTLLFGGKKIVMS
jgi:hypothetical protein